MSTYFSHPSFLSHLHSLSTTTSPPPLLRALELGSGNGYLGCSLAHSTNSLFHEIVLSDVGEHLPLMRSTVSLNQDALGPTAPAVHVTELLWGAGNGGTQARMGGPFSFIFGTDVAYRDYLHKPLLETVEELLAPEGTCLLGISLCDTTPKFFDELDKRGFRYEKVNDALVDPKFSGDLFAIIVVERQR